MTYVPFSLPMAFNLALPALGVVCTLSLFISIIMYLVGSILSDPKLVSMGKDNLYQVIMTLLLIGAFVALFTGLSAFADTLAATTNPTGAGAHVNFVQLAQAYTTYDLENVMDTYRTLMFHDMMIGVLAYTSFSVPLHLSAGAGIFEFGFLPFGGLAPIAADLAHITNLLTLVLIMVVARSEIMKFTLSVVPVFFILGLMFRSFLFTKRTGTSLIVFCTALYFVFPLSVILTHYMVYHLYKPLLFSASLGAYSAPTLYSFSNNPSGVKDFAKQYLSYEQQYTKDFNDAATSGTSSEGGKGYGSYFGSLIVNIVDFIGYALSFAWAAVVSGLAFMFNAFSRYHLFSSWILSTGATGVGFFASYYNFILGEIQSAMQLPAVLFLSFVLEIVLTVSSYRSIAIMIDSELELFGITKYI